MTHLVDSVDHPAAPKPEEEDRATRSPPKADRLRGKVAAQRAAALRFLRALLRYELGANQPSVGLAVRASAEPSLARLILSQPPRVPAGARRPRPGRLVALGPAGQEAGGRAWLTATIDRGGRRSGLLLELRPRGGRWLVSDLR